MYFYFSFYCVSSSSNLDQLFPNFPVPRPITSSVEGQDIAGWNDLAILEGQEPAQRPHWPE